MTSHLAQNLVVDLAKNRSSMVECDIHHGVLIFESFSLHIMKHAHMWLQNWLTSFLWWNALRISEIVPCIFVPKVVNRRSMEFASAWGPKPFSVSKHRVDCSHISGKEWHTILSLGAGAGSREKVSCWLWSPPNQCWCDGMCSGRGVTRSCHSTNPDALALPRASLIGWGVSGDACAWATPSLHSLWSSL